MTKRTDIHSPANANPADYDLCGFFYQGASPYIERAYAQEHAALAKKLRELGNPVSFVGNHNEKGTCDHCGAAFAHGAIFHHRPTNELISIGWICAEDSLGLPDYAARMRRKIEKQAKEEKQRQQRLEETQAWRDEHAEIVGWLTYLDTTNDFLTDMKLALQRWGALTDRQLAAVEKWREAEARNARLKATREEKLADAEPLAEGRYVIEGVIVGSKWKDSIYGTQHKITVELDDGNRVWGTCAREIERRIEDAAGDGDVVYVGNRVRFTATVAQSPDDTHFGFFNKPTKPELVIEEEGRVIYDPALVAAWSRQSTDVARTIALTNLRHHGTVV